MRPPSITTSYGEPAGTGAKAPGPAFGPHARTTHAISATRVIEVLLPGAVFTHVRNHASEPVGGIAPVGLNRALRRIRVSRFDGADNDVVLGNRGRDLIHQRVDVDAHVALGLRLDAVMKGQQTGPGGAVHVQRMELAVEAGDAAGERMYPSCASRSSAARTGVRLTPSRLASSVSISRAPAARRPPTINSRSRRYVAETRSSLVAAFGAFGIGHHSYRRAGIRARQYLYPLLDTYHGGTMTSRPWKPAP